MSPFQNGADTPLDEAVGTLPNLQGALLNWFQTLVFTRITKSIVGFENVETREEIASQGVRQPFTSQMLMMKPEGERKWKWEFIHALPGVILEIDDVLVFRGTPYRVMERRDWKEYGYIEYHIIEDYTVAP